MGGCLFLLLPRPSQFLGRIDVLPAGGEFGRDRGRAGARILKQGRRCAAERRSVNSRDSRRARACGSYKASVGQGAPSAWRGLPPRHRDAAAPAATRHARRTTPGDRGRYIQAAVGARRCAEITPQQVSDSPGTSGRRFRAAKVSGTGPAPSKTTRLAPASVEPATASRPSPSARAAVSARVTP